jgi:photosystem II stability/assembly factor-like uncharacterized protein
MPTSSALDSIIRSTITELIESAPQPPALTELEFGDAEGLTRQRRWVRRPRHRLAPILVGAAALIAAMITIAFTVVPGSVQRRNPGPPLSAHQTESPRWILAGLIDQPAWQVKGSPALSDYSLACPTVLDCYATGPSSTTSTTPSGIVELSRDGGRTWQMSLVTGAGSLLSGLNCPSALVCVVSGENFETGNLGVALFTTRDGGQSWTSQSLPGSSLGSSIISCGSASQCVVTLSQPGPKGEGVQFLAEVTHDGGVHWTTVPFPGTFRPYGLQCVSDHHCVAVGQSPTNFADSGGLSVHGTGTAVYSDDGGLTWGTGTVPPADDLLSVSCADVAHCMAVASTSTDGSSNALVSGPLIDNFVASGDGGRTWATTPGNNPEVWFLNFVACASQDDCWASGGTHASGASLRDAAKSAQPFVLLTGNGGRSWKPEALPIVDGVQIHSVSSLTCPEPGTCYALASNPSATGPRALVLVSHVTGGK